MSEEAVLYQFNENFDTMLLVIQFWTSVSFGLIVLAHFSGKKLSLFFLIGLLVLYFFFTFLMQALYVMLATQNQGLMEVMQELDGAGELTAAGRAFLISWPQGFGFIALSGSFIGLFLGSNIYPIYCYIKARRTR